MAHPGGVLVPLYLTLAYLFIFLPVLVLILFSFQGSTLPVPPFNGPSLRWYRAVFEDGRLLDVLGNSLLVGVTSSLLATVLGFLAAYGLARDPPRGTVGIRGLVLAPLTVSYLIIGLGLLATFNALGLPRSLLAAGVGHVVINLPLCFSILYAQMNEPQARIERAARDLGAAEWQVLLLVTVPLLWPAPVRRLLSRLHPLLGRVHHRVPADPVRRHPAGRDLERLAHRPQPGDQCRRFVGVRRLDRPGAVGRAGASAPDAPRERIIGAARGRAALRPHHRLDRHRSRRARWHLCRPARAVRERQDHAAVESWAAFWSPAQARC